MELCILGPLEVRVEGTVVPLGGAKQRALLAVLLLHAGEVVSSDRLIEELWGEDVPASAGHTIQVFVSRLRKALADAGAGRQVLATRSPGYVALVEPNELDLGRFEALAQIGRAALEAGDPREAARALREALGVWRGPALADFAYERFSQTAIARLEELRLAAVTDRIEADLALGHHQELVGELEALVGEHPLRERFRGQLMLALYRCGRQADALEAYQGARRALVEELGIDPSPALQQLERRILVHDPELEPPQTQPSDRQPQASAPHGRSILVVPWQAAALEPLVCLGQLLASSRTPHELLVFRLVPPGNPVDVTRASADMLGVRDALVAAGLSARAAAFSSARPGEDALRLTRDENVDLLLIPLPEEALAEGPFGEELEVLLADAPCDVALVAGAPEVETGPVVVPFGGGEHDWAALELGAWTAVALGCPLRLLGTVEEGGRRDASRLIAVASLAVQRAVGVGVEPVLVEPGGSSVARAAHGARLVVLGLGERWRQEGLGPARRAVVLHSRSPVAVARRGVRPSGLAPPTSLTRYTWTVAGPDGR